MHIMYWLLRKTMRCRYLKDDCFMKFLYLTKKKRARRQSLHTTKGSVTKRVWHSVKRLESCAMNFYHIALLPTFRDVSQFAPWGLPIVRFLFEMLRDIRALWDLMNMFFVDEASQVCYTDMIVLWNSFSYSLTAYGCNGPDSHTLSTRISYYQTHAWMVIPRSITPGDFYSWIVWQQNVNQPYVDWTECKLFSWTYNTELHRLFRCW